jgi:hypothetical protein
MPYQVANLNVSTPVRGRGACELLRNRRRCVRSRRVVLPATRWHINNSAFFADFSLARFSTLCRTVLSAPQQPLSVAERLEGKAWRAVTHHLTPRAFLPRGREPTSPSAVSEDAGCAKYECPHVWIGSSRTRSNPTLTATSIPHFSRGDTSHTYQMEIQKRLGSLTVR